MKISGNTFLVPGLLFLLLVLPAEKLFSQGYGYNQDYETWTWFQVEKQFTRHYSLSVEYELRIDNVTKGFTWGYFYLDGEYKFNKYFNTQAVYQYCTSYQFDVQSFYWGITGKYPLGNRWKVAARSAFQDEVVHFSPIYSDEKGNETKYEWRNRVSIRYKVFSNITAFAFAEPYIRYDYRTPYMDKMRNGAGFDYDMNKYNSFSLYYLYQPQFDVTKTTIANIVGVIYSITLPYKKIKWHKFFVPKKTKIIDDEENDKDVNALDKS